MVQSSIPLYVFQGVILLLESHVVLTTYILSMCHVGKNVMCMFRPDVGIRLYNRMPDCSTGRIIACRKLTFGIDIRDASLISMPSVRVRRKESDNG